MGTHGFATVAGAGGGNKWAHRKASARSRPRHLVVQAQDRKAEEAQRVVAAQDASLVDVDAYCGGFVISESTA